MKREKNFWLSVATAAALSLGWCGEKSSEYKNYQQNKEIINTEIMEMFHENNGKIHKILKDEYKEAMQYNKKYDALYTLRKLYLLQYESYHVNKEKLAEQYTKGTADQQSYRRDMIEEEANAFRLKFGDHESINQMMEAIDQGAYKMNTNLATKGVTLRDFANHLRKNY